jgi:hypothetical protein
LGLATEEAVENPTEQEAGMAGFHLAEAEVRVD